MYRVVTPLILIACLCAGGLAAAQPKSKRRAPKADQDMQVRQPHAVDRFQPASGPPGTKVTIVGQEFDETTKVRFNGHWLAVGKRTPTTLVVTIPGAGMSDHFVVVKSGFPEVSAETSFFVIRTPTITSFSPARGGVGTEVTLVGNHFLPTDRVALGAKELTPTEATAARLVVRIPEGASAGKLGIRRDGKVVASSRASFELVGQQPVIGGFSPGRGPKGTAVRISGRNFEAGDRVELGGAKVEVRSRSATSLEVVVGAQPSGTFAVIGRDGRRGESSARFTVVRALSVARFSPSFGPPGTRITVEGAGFESGDAVTIGSAMLTVRTVSDTAIVAEVPNGVASGPVAVQRGAQKVPAKGRFEVAVGPVIANVIPAAAQPGTAVTIQGRNFSPDASVLLAGAKLVVLKRRGTEELAVQIPAGARTGRLTVVTRAGSAQSPVLFTVAQPAQLTSFFPLHGPVGSKVTLRGAHFHEGMRVFLGETPLKEVQRTETTIVVVVPEGARSGVFRVESYGKRLAGRMPFTLDAQKAELEFTVAPTSARRGAEVTLTLDPPRQDATVLFDGRPLPTRVLQGGKLLVVTVPSDARTGHFEVEALGKRFRSKQPFKVR